MDLSKLDGALQRAQNCSHAWVEVCDTVAELFGGVGSIIIPVDSTARRPLLIQSSSLERATSIYINDGWYLKDIRERGLHKARENGFTTDLDFISEEEMSKIPYYSDFLRPLGLGGFIAILFKVGVQEWIISVQLPVGLLVPKTNCMETISEIREKLEFTAQKFVLYQQASWISLIENLNLLNQGVILFDLYGNVTHICDLAKEILQRNSLLTKNSKFPPSDLQEKINVQLDGLNRESTLNTMHVLSRKREFDLYSSINITPKSLRLFNFSATTLMLIVEVKSFSNRLDEVLTQVYNLTKTEKRLTEKLLEAESLKNVANSMKITEGNARQHLKKIFRKVEVDSQNQLIVKIMQECTMIAR